MYCQDIEMDGDNDIGNDIEKKLKRKKSRAIDPEELRQRVVETLLENVDYVYIASNSILNVGEEKIISLVFDKFSDWFHVMKFDEFETFDALLVCLNDIQKHILFHGHFIYKRPKQLKVNKLDRLAEFCLPLNVALSSLSVNVVKRLLDGNVDIRKRDVGMANIAHVIIISASEKRTREEEFLQLWRLIFKYISAEERNVILLEENGDGYRPFELAARLGAYALFREILNLDGHLVETSFEAGLNTYSVYNLTEYEGLESHSRFLRCPLRLIGYTTADGYDSLKKNGITRLEPIERWYDLVRRRNMIFLIVWWILRAALLFTMITVDFSVVLYNECKDNRSNETNSTNISSPQQCEHVLKLPDEEYDRAMFAIVCCFLIMIMDVIEWVSVMVDKDRRTAYRGIRSPILPFTAWTAFYRICQFFQVVLGAVTPFVASIWHGDDAFSVLLIMKALSLPLILMSILYLFEPAPSLGGFAIALQKMIESIFAFIVFLIPVLVTFATFFQSVTRQQYGFTDMASSMYVLFGLEIGTVDFGTEPGYVIAIVHVTYFFMTSVLLMNYLVAVMTAATDNDDEDRAIMIFLRRLNLVMLAQERYGQWFWRVWFHLRGARKVKIFAEEDE